MSILINLVLYEVCLDVIVVLICSPPSDIGDLIQLSPLLECDLTVCLSVTRQFGSHSNKGDNWYIISNIFASDTK